VKYRVWAALLSTALAAVTARTSLAQAPSPTPKPLTLEVGVDVVSVTAVIYDKAGRFIPGLQPHNVTLLEDGVPQTLTYFREASGGDAGIPLSVVMVLDTSGSMKENLSFLKEAASSFLTRLEEPDSALVVSFNETVKGSLEFTADIDRLDAFVNGLQVWGGTSLYDAIQYSLGRVKDRPGRKALVVISDGDDTTSSTRESDVIDYARSVEATIYTIGVRPGTGGGPDKGFLRKVASETGGSFFFPDGIGELLKVFAGISDELHNHYLLAYSPKRPPDGGFRAIEMRLDRKDAEVRVRKGYYALKRRRAGR
jgi:Ca-activated chloride channel family protein